VCVVPDALDVLQVESLLIPVVEDGVRDAEAAGCEACGCGVVLEVKRVAAGCVMSGGLNGEWGM